VVDYLAEHKLENVRMAGHSYGGMVISAVADRAPERIRRLVYWNAFVPLNGECLNDLVPPHYVAMFDGIAGANGNAVMLPEVVWRDAFINDADAALSAEAYRKLNPHPYRTFTDKIALTTELAAMQVGKSYLNFTEDSAMPHSLTWHPRLSERLGLFRLVQGPGSHEVCFTNPALLAQKLIEAGRD
jgi:pimeloyl-ACP methyl ester carboxylesterase